MTKEMIVSSNDHETTVAILEDDQLVELFIERERNRGVVGNVYKGRVSKVLPGMQSAFIDLGLERDGFLYVSDVVNTDEAFAKFSGEDEDEDEPNGNGVAKTESGVEPRMSSGTARPEGGDSRGPRNRRDERDKAQEQ